MAAPMKSTSVPGIYKRGSRYTFRYRKRGRQHWMTAGSLSEARRLKRQVEADVDRGEHRDQSAVTFGDHAREWIKTYAGRTNRGFRESTRATYRRALESYAIPYFDVERGLRLSEIEPRDVKAFIRWVAAKPNPNYKRKPGAKTERRLLSKRAVASIYAPVRALFGDAVEDGLLRSNPAYGVRVSVTQENPDAKLARALTVAELRVFLSTVDLEWRLFFEFLTQTGLRWGEATELRWSDIRFGAHPVVRVTRQWNRKRVDAPKSRYGVRDVPLSPSMAKALWTRQSASDALIFSTPTGDRLNASNVRQRVLIEAAEAAGVPWLTFHSFRHTCASLLFANGKNAKQVQMWLGHHDPAFTLARYVHLLDDGLGSADFFDGHLIRLPLSVSPHRESPPQPVANASL